VTQIFLFDLAWHTRRHVGFDKAGNHGIDANVFCAEFRRQRAGERQQRAFGRGVIGLPHHANEAGDGREIDDDAAPRTKHWARHRLAPAVNAIEVRINHAVPVVRRHEHEKRVGSDAGVVDQHVNLSGGGNNFFHGGVDGLGIILRTLNSFSLRDGGDLRGGLRVLVKREINLRALRGKAFHDSAANPARPAGDDDHLSFKFAAHSLVNLSQRLISPPDFGRPFLD